VPKALTYIPALITSVEPPVLSREAGSRSGKIESETHEDTHSFQASRETPGAVDILTPFIVVENRHPQEASPSQRRPSPRDKGAMNEVLLGTLFTTKGTIPSCKQDNIGMKPVHECIRLNLQTPSCPEFRRRSGVAAPGSVVQLSRYDSPPEAAFHNPNTRPCSTLAYHQANWGGFHRVAPMRSHAREKGDRSFGLSYIPIAQRLTLCESSTEVWVAR